MAEQSRARPAHDAHILLITILGIVLSHCGTALPDGRGSAIQSRDRQGAHVLPPFRAATVRERKLVAYVRKNQSIGQQKKADDLLGDRQVKSNPKRKL